MHPRLRPGALLYETSDGSWRCHVAGVFLRVHAPPRTLRVLQAVLHGAATLEQARARSSDLTELDGLLEAFRDQGLLATSGPSTEPGLPTEPVLSTEPVLPTGRSAGLRVAVEGTGSVAEVVSRELATRVEVMRGEVSEATLTGTDFVVACAAWLPDERWQRLDRWCASAGVPWHRCHAEDDAIVVGPIARPDRGPRYADTRARRLAAAPFPDELAELWRALDAGLPLPALPPPPLPTAEAVARLILDDLWAWFDGRPSPGDGVQTVVGGPTAARRRHVVLALPDLEAATS